MLYGVAGGVGRGLSLLISRLSVNRLKKLRSAASCLFGHVKRKVCVARSFLRRCPTCSGEQ